MYKLFLILCSLCLSANEILWSGKTVSLIEEDGHIAITSRALSDEEKIEFERTVAKMQTVFEKVFGFGDFIRWMPLDNENFTSYLIPAGAYVTPNEVDYNFKIRVMLFSLKKKKEALHPLKDDQIRAIQAVASEILPLSQSPIILKDGHFTRIKMEESLSLALNELGEPIEMVSSPSPRSSSFSANCKVFCNPNVLKKQSAFDSTHIHVLYNSWPYVDCHLMLIPMRHITTLSEEDDSEILDKFSLLSRIRRIASEKLEYPCIGMLTRIGWRAGQTQPHLHDHVIGFNPEGSQPWIRNWVSVLTGNPIPTDPIQWEKGLMMWKTSLTLPP